MENKKVLIAEDDDLLRKILVRHIGSNFKNLDIDDVATCKELIEKSRSIEYSLILTDNNMEPGTNGAEAIEEIRKFDKKTPIYMLSGSSRAKDDALKSGATGFLDKCDDKGLDEVLSTYLK